MANATADSYSAASGATVRGGRFGGLRTASAVGGIASAEAFGSSLVVPTIPSTGTELTTFTLQSAAGTGTYPFRIGLGFAKGETTQVACNLPNYQVEVKRTWNDGSVKHAIITGRASMTSAPSVVSVTNNTPASGAALTFSLPANTSVQLGSFGTATLSTATLVRTWSSGPELVERHYRSDVGTSGMSVWFRVRHFADGRKWVKVRVENGYLDNGSGGVATNVDRTYIPIVTLNGTIIYNNGGASLTHYKNTTWFYEGWIGGDPQVTALHNVIHLRKSRLVPNYGWGQNASSTTLNNLVQTYTPMSSGALPAAMSAPGDDHSIALLPQWNALYIMTGDSRALKSTIANASSLASYGITWRDKTTNLPIKPSSFSTWSLAGPGGSGDRQVTRGSLEWEINHHPGEAYLAYLLTGDYDHYESMLLTSSLMYVMLSNGPVGIISSRGNGTSRILAHETRGAAWALRSLSLLCGLAPSVDNVTSPGLGNPVADEYKTLLSNNVAYWKTWADNPSINGLGMVYAYSSRVSVTTGDPLFGDVADGYDKPWMHLWWVAALGMGSNTEPLSTMTTYNALRDWMYKIPVGLLGSSTGFKWSYASGYTLKFSNGNSLDPTTWYSTWAQVFTNSFGSAPDSTGMINVGNIATGESTPASGGAGGPDSGPASRWAYLMGAIAYAVEHSATGAAASWNRLLTATNWGTYDAAVNGSETMHDDPKWLVWPRDPNWYADQRVGEWREITGSKPMTLGAFDYAGDNGGPTDGGTANWITAWNGLAVDTRSGDLISFGNGGHGDYFGNEINALGLLTDAPAWRTLLSASALTAIPGQGTVPLSPAYSSTYYPDGRPGSAHTYYCTHVLESIDRCVRFGGCSIANEGFSKADVASFNLTNNTCDAAGTRPNMPINPQFLGPALTKDNNDNVYFKYTNTAIYKYSAASNTWSSALSGGFPPSDLNVEEASAYDVVRGRIAYLKSNLFATYTVSPAAWSSLITLTGAAAGALTALNKAVGMEYIPALDRFLVRGGNATGGTVYSINPADNTVATFTTTGGSSIPAVDAVVGSAENVYGKWRYVPRLRGMVYVPGWNKNAWFLRTH